ncbi:MAG TPA: DUF2809 domain-containing protein [Chryseolinea sp.]|nr:DUF2809 domain-containing protein [Chryseolinea sp.]
MKLTFNTIYFTLTILLFITEVLIALFATSNFVRSYLGDVLVVILLYCFIRSFFKVPVFALAIGVLVFAITIEFLQYVKIVNILGLQKSSLARTVIGTSFAWLDILAYIAGTAVVLVIERLRKTA